MRNANVFGNFLHFFLQKAFFSSQTLSFVFYLFVMRLSFDTVCPAFFNANVFAGRRYRWNFRAPW